MAAEYKRTAFANVFWKRGVLYFAFRDERRKRKVRRAGEMTPREASMAQAAAQANADRIRSGLESKRAAAARTASELPIAGMIARYIEALTARGRSKAHLRDTGAYLRRWARECGVHSLADADPHRLALWLDELREGEGGVSARTANAYRTAALALCAWATDHGLIALNPIPSRLIHRAGEDADRRKLSRAMPIADFHRLLERAEPRRAAFYALAGFVGLRWKEIARLRWGDIDLESSTLTIDASRTKNGREAELPIPAPALERLRAIRPGTPAPSTAIFRGMVQAPTWKRDLRRAGLIGLAPLCARDGYTGRRFEPAKGPDPLYADDRGRYLDRKCLRMCFATWLKEAGVDLRDAQRLMRHSDPRLTSTIYTDLRIASLRAASDRFTAHAGSAGEARSARGADPSGENGEIRAPRLSAG